MKLLISCLFLLFFSNLAAQKRDYFQQEASFDIRVALNDSAHTLTGFETLEYVNHSPDTLNFIWFHLWPNAYKNDRTAFSEQMLKLGRTDFYFSPPEEKGYINRLNFRVGGIPATYSYHPEHIDIAKLQLPSPLPPGDSVTITTPFHVKLPYLFSRSGYIGKAFQITQWYPKPAVYDNQGWHPMPYLDQGEFYSEFGNYHVEITVPENYVVAATGMEVSGIGYQVSGVRQEESSKKKLAIGNQQYKPQAQSAVEEAIQAAGAVRRGGSNTSLRRSRAKKKKTAKRDEVSDKEERIKNKVESNKKKKTKRKKQHFKPHHLNRNPIAIGSQPSTLNSQPSISNPEKTKTLTFVQNAVHDFAWFAHPDWVVMKDSLTLLSGKKVQLFSYFPPDEKELWANSLSDLKQTLLNRSKLLGEYPYSTAKLVAAPKGITGGMEYPAITVISAVSDSAEMANLIGHEAGHFWLYSLLGTNERTFPWMDEGINTFLDYQFQKKSKEKKGFLERRIPENTFDISDLIYRKLLAAKKDQPIATPSEDFSKLNYQAIAYHKTALWMKYLQGEIGKNILDSGLHEYGQRWAYKHPDPSDFQKIMEDVSGKDLDTTFSLLHQKGSLTPPVPKKIKLDFLFNLRNTDKYNYIFLSPAIGYNYYDQFMIGGLIHNYTLPVPKFHFLLAPMYATGSKEITGLGRIGYSHTSYGKIRKADVSLSFSRFNMDSFTDSTGKKTFMDFVKWLPAIRLTFRNKDPWSKVNKYIQWKTYLIKETSLFFSRDTVNGGDIITYPKKSRYLNQLLFSYEDSRALYPFSTQLKVEQGEYFFRLGLEGKYYFNYAHSGGLQARIFAGKLIYIGEETSYKRAMTNRYYLNMTGPNGEEDYTYSDYFVGRNEFEGPASQQIMIRDGGFKVRTDMLNRKVGKTDDWLAAVNLQTDIPKDLNPLQVLPFDIGLKAFLDIGTYAEAWKEGSNNSKFLYDAGLQLSLIQGLVNIYMPVLYSKVYRNYYRQTIPKNKRFGNSISFSINIGDIRLKKILHIE